MSAIMHAHLKEFKRNEKKNKEQSAKKAALQKVAPLEESRKETA